MQQFNPMELACVLGLFGLAQNFGVGKDMPPAIYPTCTLDLLRLMVSIPF